jgi:hypothetical protein
MGANWHVPRDNIAKAFFEEGFSVGSDVGVKLTLCERS